MEPVTTMVNGKELTVGEIDNHTATFIKKVKRESHYLNVVKGYAIQMDVFDDLVSKGIQTVLIKETDTGHSYEAPLSVWQTNGGKWTKGHGEQRTLSLKYMKQLT